MTLDNSESVKVMVRCRPLNQKELDSKSKVVFFTRPERAQCTLHCYANEEKSKSFTFDRVYTRQVSTEDIYNDIAYPLVEGVTDGYNGTIFAYGQTGCGKSYTMQGVLEPKNMIGITTRAFNHIFEKIGITDKMKYLMYVSYLEIYNEVIHDLLAHDTNVKHELKEHPEHGVYVQDLSVHSCKSIQDCQKLTERGWKNRATGATLMNVDSSRSHSIFTIKLECIEGCEDGNDRIRQGKLNLVDLAGSERQSKSGAVGSRLKEATKINLSLSALGNVISALVNPKCKHIPYRDAKLTRLLQDSLGGNTKTLMIACVAPTESNFDESMSTLRYANRAKNIKNKPIINEDAKDTLLREYKSEIDRLSTIISNYSHKSDINWENEKHGMEQEYQQKLNDIKSNCSQLEYSKERLEQEISRLNKSYNTRKSTNSNDSAIDDESVDIKVARKRLADLEHVIVGGENANDQIAIKNHYTRLTFAQQRQIDMIETLKSVEGEQVVVNIIENLHNELLRSSKLLEEEKITNNALEMSIVNTTNRHNEGFVVLHAKINKLERENILFNIIIERMESCMRANSNFANVNKLKTECKWNQKTGEWFVPQVKLLKATLPDNKPNKKHTREYRIKEETDNYLKNTLKNKGLKRKSTIFNTRQNQLLEQMVSPTDTKPEILKEITSRSSRPMSTTRDFGKFI